MVVDTGRLFERQLVVPHPSARDRLDRLVGLDHHKEKLAKMLGLLVNPKALKEWGEQHHPGAALLLDTVLHRPPLVILAGDVGSGKTELAESIGDVVAREQDIEVVLLPLSLSARGQGKVGEMTHLLSAAFDYAVKEAHKLQKDAIHGGAVILLVDEADALAQSRESQQMHHEDRTGVNAFIRGVDRLANERLPAAVIMCTNRYQALDPAVKRRAAEILEFGRPDETQRRAVLEPRLGQLGFGEEEIAAVIAATGPQGDRPGYTFSDLMQRYIPNVVLDAYPSKSIDAARAVRIAHEMQPTPPFKDEYYPGGQS